MSLFLRNNAVADELAYLHDDQQAESNSENNAPLLQHEWFVATQRAAPVQGSAHAAIREDVDHRVHSERSKRKTLAVDDAVMLLIVVSEQKQGYDRPHDT